MCMFTPLTVNEGSLQVNAEDTVLGCPKDTPIDSHVITGILMYVMYYVFNMYFVT